MRRVLTVLLFAFSLPLFADITVSTITPAAGLIEGGTIVHLHGTNLLGAPLACASVECSVYVRFGTTLGTVIFDSADEIVVIAPAHPAGPVDLIVNVPVGPALILNHAFLYQDPKSDSVRLLLPIAAGTQGILNSSWQTDVLAHNETTSQVDLAGTTILPGSTRKLALSPASTGMFLRIPRNLFDGVTITTHVHDTVHDSENLGVDVPSVPETQFRRAVVLPGVPNDARYRVLLRVYGYPGTYPVTVRVRDDSTGELLSSQDVTIGGSDVAYLQLPISAAQSAHVVRVEVTTAQAAAPPIWAFVTLTNNTTENVTIITPKIAVAPEVSSSVLAAGHWGHAGYCMTVSPPDCGPNCAAFLTVTYACLHGSFTVPVIYPDGHFDADGDVTNGGAFPKTGTAAHLSGLVSGGSLTMTIQYPGTTVGPVTLNYGSTEPCFLAACP